MTMIEKNIPADWMVRNSRGAVWPPGFVSQLADPKSPHTMHKRNGATAEQATANRRRCAELGIGLGNGTIPGLSKQNSVIDESSRKYKYRFVSSVGGGKSVMHEIWIALSAAPAGTRKTDAEIARIYGHRPSRIRAMFRDAVNAGIFQATRRGDEVSYELGPTKPANGGPVK